MVERAAEETSEPEDAAFAHGSLGRLAPAWWEPAEGEPEPEPWLSPDAALDRFLDWTSCGPTRRRRSWTSWWATT